MQTMLSQFMLLCFILLLQRTSTASDSSSSVKSKDSQSDINRKEDLLPPCQACRTLVNSFKKGMNRTARGKFEGGDTSWEESRLKSYADSEIRLVEIQEKLCSEVEKSADQCHRLADEHETVIEDWWLNKRKEFPDLYYYLCIDTVQVCCPENHYGPECKPCFGGIVNPCSGHGQCKGAGTRKGSGLCRCDSGYTGDLCDACKVGYFNDTTDSNGWVCAKCDPSCKGHCREGGPKGCEVCADGYHYSVEFGCIDLDECIESIYPPCKLGTFCVNTIGSYRCVECDRSCYGCTGDGPDMCVKCAEGYVLQDGLCIENKAWKRSVHIEVARYATYLGLCIATCIIFRRNVYLASLIGVFVALYIGLSEYTVGDWEKRSFTKTLKSFLVL